MTAILFVIGCAGFAIVIAWTYAADLDGSASGEGLLAMAENIPPDIKQAPRPPRWRQEVAPKPAGKLGKPDAARPATRGWPRRRRGA
jgi:hypothetical protein